MKFVKNLRIFSKKLALIKIGLVLNQYQIYSLNSNNFGRTASYYVKCEHIVTVFTKVEAEQFRCTDYKSNAGGPQCQVRLGWVRLGQVRLGQVWLGQVWLGQVRLVRLVQVTLSLNRNVSILIAQVRLVLIAYAPPKIQFCE